MDDNISSWLTDDKMIGRYVRLCKAHLGYPARAHVWTMTHLGSRVALSLSSHREGVREALAVLEEISAGSVDR